MGVIEEEDPLDDEQRSQEHRMGGGSRLEGSRQMIEVHANVEPLRDKSETGHIDPWGGKKTHQATQDWKGSQHHSNKGQSHDNGRTLRIGLEDVVNLGESAVSRDFDGRKRLVGVAGDSQLEGSFIVCLSAAEGADEESGI